LTKNIIRPRNEIDIDLSAKIFAECIESEEGKEGIKSFFEKKKPYWAVRS
jgi:enoyl-CoA hydratase/carnithine racemase